MIDLEKLRKLSVLYEVDNQPMKIDVDLFRELLDHIAQLEKYESRLITERDHRDDVIDRMADAVLGSDRHEWTSAYDIDDAAEEVEQRIAQLEKDAARWNAATRNMELNDICVVVYDNFGDGRTVTGEEADQAIDTAMEAKHG